MFSRDVVAIFVVWIVVVIIVIIGEQGIGDKHSDEKYSARSRDAICKMTGDDGKARRHVNHNIAKIRVYLKTRFVQNYDRRSVDYEPGVQKNV